LLTTDDLAPSNKRYFADENTATAAANDDEVGHERAPLVFVVSTHGFTQTMLSLPHAQRLSRRGASGF